MPRFRHTSSMCSISSQGAGGGEDERAAMGGREPGGDHIARDDGLPQTRRQDEEGVLAARLLRQLDLVLSPLDEIRAKHRRENVGRGIKVRDASPPSSQATKGQVFSRIARSLHL